MYPSYVVMFNFHCFLPGTFLISISNLPLIIVHPSNWAESVNVVIFFTPGNSFVTHSTKQIKTNCWCCSYGRRSCSYCSVIGAVLRSCSVVLLFCYGFSSLIIAVILMLLL